MITLEEFPQGLLDAAVELGVHHVGCAAGDFHDSAALRHQCPVLEHILGCREHLLAVGKVFIHGDVGGGARAEMPAVREPEAACRRGTGHDRDLVQGVLATQPGQFAVRRGLRMDLRELAVAEVPVHQQPDQVRIAGERRTVRMVGGEEYAPRVLHAQEQFQSDCPLQRVDEDTVAVTERHHAAAGVALDVHAHPFVRVCVAAVAVLCHGVAGCRHSLPEHDLSHVHGDVLLPVDGLRDARCAEENLRSPSVP